MTLRTKLLLATGLAGLVVIALGTTWYVRHFHRYTPKEVLQDLRAGAAARHDPRPVERYLEIRYGPLTESANRQKAFLDFFNVGHIEGLQIMTRHMSAPEREANTAAMAQWVAGYRQTMSGEEKEALRSFIQSDTGRLTVRRATTQYLSQDVRYRAATAAVIRELMTTLTEIEKP
jgi:hypothetical protein